MGERRVGILQFAGLCRPNPGTAAIGLVIYDSESKLDSYSQIYPYCTHTNSAAHYLALITGLKRAKSLGITHLVALGHSESLCKQVLGECEVNNSELQHYCNEVQDLMDDFTEFRIMHIYRETNLEAIFLADSEFD